MSVDSGGVAVLIDGDSVESKYFGPIIAWATRNKPSKIRRIYGDSKKLASWKDCMANHGITPVDNPTSHKNAADIMLAMDAAEILCTRHDIRDFCIAAHDNDFAGLVQWMHGRGARVEVVWSSDQKNHATSFRDMCDGFITVNELPYVDGGLGPEALEKLSEWKDRVKEATKKHAGSDGWALLSDVGNSVKPNMADFKYTDYCHKTMISLIGMYGEFEIKSDPARLCCREP